jgi:hypothetical protein
VDRILFEEINALIERGLSGGGGFVVADGRLVERCGWERASNRDRCGWPAMGRGGQNHLSVIEYESHACGGGCKTESHQCESAWTDLSASLKSWSTPWMEHTHHLPRLISGYFLPGGGGGKFHNKNFCNHSTSINLRNHASRIWKCSHRSRNLGRFAS